MSKSNHTSSAPDGLSRRERERLRRRQAMLHAARSVFAEKGYARATLDEIAERAEFGKGTLYNYFEGGKEEILFAVVEEIYDDVCALIREVFTESPGRSFRESYHAFVKKYFDYFHGQQEHFMILVKEAHRLAFSENPDRVRFFQQQQERMVNTLLPVLERAEEQNEIQSLPLHAIAHMLLANANGIVIHSCLVERNNACMDTSPVLQNATTIADFLTTMLFDGLTLNAPAETHTDHA